MTTLYIDEDPIGDFYASTAGYIKRCRVDWFDWETSVDDNIVVVQKVALSHTYYQEKDVPV